MNLDGFRVRIVLCSQFVLPAVAGFAMEMQDARLVADGELSGVDRGESIELKIGLETQESDGIGLDCEYASLWGEMSGDHQRVDADVGSNIDEGARWPEYAGEKAKFLRIVKLRHEQQTILAKIIFGKQPQANSERFDIQRTSTEALAPMTDGEREPLA